jgi:hypothetical protein
MTEAVFRRIALGFSGAIEGSHMGHPDFRAGAGGGIFATLHGDRATGMVKLTPEQQREAIQQHPGMFEPEAGAWGLQGCTRVHLRHATEEVLGDAMTQAWQNATAKKPRAARKAR